jgi:hypothetical protein
VRTSTTQKRKKKQKLTDKTRGPERSESGENRRSGQKVPLRDQNCLGAGFSPFTLPVDSGGVLKSVADDSCQAKSLGPPRHSGSSLVVSFFSVCKTGVRALVQR